MTSHGMSRQVVEQVRAAVGEVDPRHAEIGGGLEQPARRPQGPAPGVLGAERADPRVEDLHRLGAVGRPGSRR